MSLRPFEQIVTEYGPMVLRVCRAVVGQADAEDAWSEAFLAALKAYPALPPDANVEAWLVTIAHRKAIDLVRLKRPIPVETIPERGTSPPVPDDGLWDAVKALPDKQRLAVAYHYMGGLPFKEIAAITGGSTDAARRAAADGIKTLRRTYQESNDEVRSP